MQWKKIKLRSAQEMLKISTYNRIWKHLSDFIKQLFAEGEGQINE